MRPEKTSNFKNDDNKKTNTSTNTNAKTKTKIILLQKAPGHCKECPEKKGLMNKSRAVWRECDCTADS